MEARIPAPTSSPTNLAAQARELERDTWRWVIGMACLSIVIKLAVG